MFYFFYNRNYIRHLYLMSIWWGSYLWPSDIYIFLFFFVLTLLYSCGSEIENPLVYCKKKKTYFARFKLQQYLPRVLLMRCKHYFTFAGYLILNIRHSMITALNPLNTPSGTLFAVLPQDYKGGSLRITTCKIYIYSSYITSQRSYPRVVISCSPSCILASHIWNGEARANPSIDCKVLLMHVGSALLMPVKKINQV